MYDLSRLRQLALSGLRDLGGAALGVGGNALYPIVLRRIWGPHPVLVGLIAILGCVALGGAMQRLVEENETFELLRDVSWPLVLFALLCSWRVRRVLFGGCGLRAELEQEDPLEAFHAMALPVAFGAITAVVADFLLRTILRWGEATGAEGAYAIASRVLSVGLHFLEMGALLSILVASLGYSESWLEALWDVVWRLFVFKILLSLTLMFLSMLPVGMLIGWVLSPFLSAVPPELQQLFDQIGESSILAIVYLGLIGGIWTVAGNHFPELLRSQRAAVLDSLEQVMDESEKKSEA